MREMFVQNPKELPTNISRDILGVRRVIPYDAALVLALSRLAGLAMFIFEFV